MDHHATRPDVALVEASLAGDQRAFAALIGRYAPLLGTLIRHRVGDASHAEDVWQETVLVAWRDLAQLRDPSHVRAWLMQIGRNQCRAHHRSVQRRDVPMPDDELAGLVNRFGRVGDTAASRSRAVRTIAAARPADRDILRAFYIDGFTIREIAARREAPVGTVKRRLHTARRRLRETMGVTPADRRTNMALRLQPFEPAAFPDKRPAIEIRPLAEQPPHMDCRELRWWYIVPTSGDAVSFAAYDAPNWTLGSVNTLCATAEANVHGVAGVRIDVDEHGDGATVQDGVRTMYGCLGERDVKWLGVVERHDGRERLATFLDSGWDEDWGGMPRRIDARGFRELAAGVFETDGDDHLCGATGMFEVTIGPGSHRCVRVLDLDLLGQAATDEAGVLIEAYLSLDAPLVGRTVLCRRYNGRNWSYGGSTRWDDRLPNSPRLVIDGATYVHWYDHVVSVRAGAD